MSSLRGITSESSCRVRAVPWLNVPCGSPDRLCDQSCQSMRSGRVPVGNCTSRAPLEVTLHWDAGLKKKPKGR